MNKILSILVLLCASVVVACEHGDTIEMRVLTEDGWRDGIKIDRCIAPIIAALNAGGLATVTSCCGHGRENGRGKTGYILCAKGILLEIHPERGLGGGHKYELTFEQDGRFWGEGYNDNAE